MINFDFEIKNGCISDFPVKLFRIYITVFLLIFTELESKHEFVVKVRDMVKTWPRPIVVVMRYLFAFLNHLSEFRYVKTYIIENRKSI